MTEQELEILKKSTTQELCALGYSRSQAVKIHKGENPDNWSKKRYSEVGSRSVKDRPLSGQTISLQDDPRVVLIKISERDQNAISVLGKLLKQGPSSLLLLLDLDDMGIRGAAIHVAYETHCGGDLTRFIDAIVGRDPDMVKMLQKAGFNVAEGGKS